MRHETSHPDTRAARSRTATPHLPQKMQSELCPSKNDGMIDHAKTERPSADEVSMLRQRVSELEGLTKDQQDILSRLEQSERRFRGLTDNALDSIAILDAEGRILYESPSTERIWGIAVAGRGGRNKASSVHPADHRRLASNYARSLRQPGVPIRADYRVLHVDGSLRTVETVTTNLLLDPSIKGVVVNFRDVTQRKLAEEQLRRSEAELRLLSQEILKVAEQERSRIARELHDHIGSELAFLQVKTALLAGHLKGSRAAEQEKAELIGLAERIQADCHRVVMSLGSTMIDDLGLMRSIEWYVEEFERRTGISCAVDTPIGDIETNKACAMAAYRIVQEALTNVWKHARASEVEVKVAAKGNTLNVIVSDDGVGFDRTGHGVGKSLGLLSMVERAHLLGGTLTISSKTGKGTRVAARLPIGQSPSQKETAARGPESLSEGDGRRVRSSGLMIRVLLADDHTLMRTGLKRIIEEAGVATVVAEASDGLEAVLEFERVRPDVVILDISMPKMDGLEAIKRIRELDPRARILVLTVHPERQYAVRFLKAGALGYVTKGIGTSELPEAIQTVAQGRRYLANEAKDVLAMQLLASRSDVAPLDRLSNRELQIVCLIARGKRIRDIADELGISINTVHTYRSRLLEKLSVGTDAEICQFAFANGLVDVLSEQAS
jgi:two-component system invasion response regulator UvrY